MPPLTFSLIQSDLSWENKKENLTNFEKKIKQCSDKSEVVILPEMFSTGFSMNATTLAENMSGETVQWMRKISNKQKIILTGSIIAEEENKFYNRLIWMQPDGNFGLYDKRHLFAYSGEDKYYQQGNKRLITSVKGWKILMQICYDLRFPVWCRQTPVNNKPVNDPFERGSGIGHVPEYDVIIYVANWPERRSNAWRTLLCARAIENQCYVIGVNRVGTDGNNISYSGNTMAVDPLGEILYEKINEEDIHTLTFEKDRLEEIRKKFPFLQDGDAFHRL